MSEPNEKRGEVGIRINGEPKIIRFSLRAQTRVVQSLGLDSVEKIPELMRKMDGEILAQLIHCALIPDHEMSVEDLLEANLPMYPTMDALLKAINLATWGTPDGTPFDQSPSSNETEKMSESPGVSLRH